MQEISELKIMAVRTAQGEMKKVFLLSGPNSLEIDLNKRPDL